MLKNMWEQYWRLIGLSENSSKVQRRMGRLYLIGLAIACTYWQIKAIEAQYALPFDDEDDEARSCPTYDEIFTHINDLGWDSAVAQYGEDACVDAMFLTESREAAET